MQQSTVSAKKSKVSAECSTGHGSECTAQPLDDVLDTAAKLSGAAADNQAAGCCNGHTALPKENRSPNLTFLDHLEAELDTYSDLNQVLLQH